VDLVGGLRYNSIRSELGLSGTPVAAAEDWWDPFIGVRAQIPLAERWSLMGYADIGGFGVGSDFTWQALVGVNYAFSTSTTMRLGYREVSVDYDRGNFLYDMRMGGVYLSMSVRF
jgi:opacity protein-like surface antigen